MSMTAGQRWSRNKPTAPGWYWHKRTDGTVMVHEVVSSFDRLWIDLSQYGVLDKILVSNVNAGEWQGPITPHDQEAG